MIEEMFAIRKETCVFTLITYLIILIYSATLTPYLLSDYISDIHVIIIVAYLCRSSIPQWEQQCISCMLLKTTTKLTVIGHLGWRFVFFLLSNSLDVIWHWRYCMCGRVYNTFKKNMIENLFLICVTIIEIEND